MTTIHYGDRWTLRFLRLAKEISSWSKDPSTKVGTLMVDVDKNILATGFNGFPRQVVDDPIRYEDRNIKYKMICHAEANAIAAAARNGHSLHGCICYTTNFPCSTCCGLLIQAGVLWVYYLGSPDYEERWKEDIEISKVMFHEAGVVCQKWDLESGSIQKSSATP